MAREAVAGLPVFLQGMWGENMAANKFHKFFTALAIKQVVDAWWDQDERCMVTQADADMENIIQNDMDLFFPKKEEEIDINLTNLDKEEVETEGLLSVGSISTFWTKGKESQSGTKLAPKNKSKDLQAKSKLDQEMPKKDISDAESKFDCLITWVMKEMQVDDLPEAKPNSSPPSGSKAGKPPWV